MTQTRPGPHTMLESQPAWVASLCMFSIAMRSGLKNISLFKFSIADSFQVIIKPFFAEPGIHRPFRKTNHYRLLLISPLSVIPGAENNMIHVFPIRFSICPYIN